MRTLTDLKKGKVGTVVMIDSDCIGYERFRLLDLGVVPGTKITQALENPLNDPLAYWIRGAVIALRKEQTNKIYIEIENE